MFFSPPTPPLSPSMQKEFFFSPLSRRKTEKKRENRGKNEKSVANLSLCFSLFVSFRFPSLWSTAMAAAATIALNTKRKYAIRGSWVENLVTHGTFDAATRKKWKLYLRKCAVPPTALATKDDADEFVSIHWIHLCSMFTSPPPPAAAPSSALLHFISCLLLRVCEDEIELSSSSMMSYKGVVARAEGWAMTCQWCEWTHRNSSDRKSICRFTCTLILILMRFWLISFRVNDERRSAVNPVCTAGTTYDYSPLHSVAHSVCSSQ